MEERRVTERVKPADDCIVVHSKKIGSIKNISSSGLYCSCFQDSNCETNIHKEIDILCGHGKFLVKGLRVTIIDSDSVTGRFLSNFEVKTCRMKFVELEEEQSSGIETIVVGACIH